jgi:hypothetical protein
LIRHYILWYKIRHCLSIGEHRIGIFGKQKYPTEKFYSLDNFSKQNINLHPHHLLLDSDLDVRSKDAKNKNFMYIEIGWV